MFRYSADHSKNFLDTFGYLDLTLPKDFDYEQLILDINRESSKLLSLQWSEIVRQKRSFMVPAFADHSQIASNFMVNHLDACIQALIGKNYFYIGSDASIFFAPGSAWHRDMAMRLPLLKVNIYVDFNSKDESCDFLIVPGSHHVSTAYSGLLQKALGWPDVPGIEGGLCERGFLPQGSDPTSVAYDHRNDPVPSKALSVKPGAAVIFNTAALHAVKSSVPLGRPRRLVTFIFCANPIDLEKNHYARDPLGKNYTNDALLEELYHWRAMDCIRHNVSDYGPQLQNYPDYVQAHGVDWTKIVKLSKELDLGLKQEDGSHEQYQMQKMSQFLVQNIPDTDGCLAT
jgi:hypothetical protein